MTKIFYKNAPDPPDWKANNSQKSNNKCEYICKKSNWEYNEPTVHALKDENWSCPHPKHQESEYCIFHKKPEEKTPKEVQEAFLEAVNNPNRRSEFIGSIFTHLDIREIVLEDSKHSKIDLRNCKFVSGITLDQIKLNTDIIFDGSIFYKPTILDESRLNAKLSMENSLHLSSSDFSVNDSTLSGEFNIDDSIFHSSFIIYQSEFKHKLQAENVKFCDLASLQSCQFRRSIIMSRSKFTKVFEDKPSPNFYDSYIGGDAWLQDTLHNSSCNFESIECAGKLNLLRGDFKKPLNIQNASVEDTLIFSQAKLPKEIVMNSTTVNEIRIDHASVNETKSHLKLIGANVQSGKMFQPKSGVLLIDFSGGKIGDVQLKPSRHISALAPLNNLSEIMSEDREINFNNIRFFETEFDGFHFDRYHNELAAENWNIHRLQGQSPQSMSLPFKIEGNGNIEDTTNVVETDVMSSTNLESTYLKAKQGANQIGDTKSESEFLIKEMKFRNLTLRSEFSEYLNSKLSRNKTEADIFSGPRWILNSFLGISCGYGERIWFIILHSISVILGFRLIYPLTRGIKDNMGRNINFINQDVNLSAIEIIGESIYFSAVTFSTLGYGDYLPLGRVAKFLAATEAFTGSFLIALLIFTLGRRVSR